MSAKRKVRVFRFEPVGFDRFDRKASQPEPGTLVVKTQPAGTPRNGTFGHCFVQDAESGDFYGLVLEASLQRTDETVVPRDKAAEAREARSPFTPAEVEQRAAEVQTYLREGGSGSLSNTPLTRAAIRYLEEQK